MEFKDKIMKLAIEEFNDKGIKFTMDDLAKTTGVSKRTIYEQLGNKEEIINLIIEEAFLSIKNQEKEILCNEDLELVEKVKKIIGVMPTLGGKIEYRRMFELKYSYPNLYEKIESKLTEDWDKTLLLINKGIEEGKLKPVNVDILKEIFLSTMEAMLRDKFLLDKNLGYNEVLDNIIEIIFNGLVV